MVVYGGCQYSTHGSMGSYAKKMESGPEGGQARWL